MKTKLIDYFYYMLNKLELDIIGFDIEINNIDRLDAFEIKLVNKKYNVGSSCNILKMHIFNDEIYDFNKELLNKTLYYLLVACFKEVLL